jgi:hypothetical protein
VAFQSFIELHELHYPHWYWRYFNVRLLQLPDNNCRRGAAPHSQATLPDVEPYHLYRDDHIL